MLVVRGDDRIETVARLGRAIGAMPRLEHLDLCCSLCSSTRRDIINAGGEDVDVRKIMRAFAPGVFASRTLKHVEMWACSLRDDLCAIEIVACMLAARRLDALAWGRLETFQIQDIPECLINVMSAALPGVCVS